MITKLRRSLRLVAFRKRAFWWGSFAWIVFFLSPILPGLLIARALTIMEEKQSTAVLITCLLGALLIDVGTRIMLRFGHRMFIGGLEAANGLARFNVVHAQLSNQQEQRSESTNTTGDALARLRDDPREVVMFVDNYVDVLGSSAFVTAAVIILGRTQPLATLVAVLPLILVAVANQKSGNLIRRYRSKSRGATSDVASFLNASLGAALTIKLSGAKDKIVSQLDELNAKRAKTMVADQVVSETMHTLNAAVSSVCVGLALVVAARNSVSTSEVALFTSYAASLVWFPVRLGAALSGRRRMEVSSARLDELLPPSTATYDFLTEHRSLPLLGGPQLVRETQPARQPLHRLDIVELGISERNISPRTFTVLAGSLTVIAGPVGSGKSSILQAILGLIEAQGTVLWNGVGVVDRSAFFSPPHSSYVAQVPTLFADTIENNIRLGLQLGSEQEVRAAIAVALQRACFADEVASFPDGDQTIIGSRGVRLSGGQAQRLATARALVHQPELFVVDDLSSALDVETELALWAHVRTAGLTVLAVSNRPVVLASADQVISL
jgi:ATP-binding cassette, subfamily B, bacterial